MIKRITLLVVSSILLIAGLVYFWPFKTDSLSIQAAGERAQSLYGGTIEDTAEENGHYMVQLRKNGQIYQIELGNTDGAILSMDTLEGNGQGEHSDQEDAPGEKKQEGEKPDNSGKEQKAEKSDNNKKTQDPSNEGSGNKNDGLITAVKASEIVLKNVDGNALNSSVEAELDEDDDRRIYEVELELTDGGEAEAEIDAVTGKVLYFYAE